MDQVHTICWEIFLIIMRTSLVIAGVKHCSVLSESVTSGKTSLMIKFDRMRAILSVKYFEKELHNVSGEECSGSAFNFCRCRIVFTDLYIWRRLQCVASP